MRGGVALAMPNSPLAHQRKYLSAVTQLREMRTTGFGILGRRLTSSSAEGLSSADFLPQSYLCFDVPDSWPVRNAALNLAIVSHL